MSIDLNSYDALVLTGSSGAVGEFALHEILKAYSGKVYCLLRNERSLSKLKSQETFSTNNQVSFIFADLSNPSELQTAFASIPQCNRLLVIHSAADVSWTKGKSLLTPINVEGTENLARLAVERSVNPCSFIFLSTSYIRDDGQHRNSYEETKAIAEKILVERFSETMKLGIVRCSLIVGSSEDGRISAFNGFYPIVRVIGLAEVPCLIADENYRIDMIPVNYVVSQILLCAELLVSAKEPVRLCLALGGASPQVKEVVGAIQKTSNEYRQELGLTKQPSISVINRRQFDFLMQASHSWNLHERFDLVERLSKIMSGYTQHGETEKQITPTFLEEPAPPASQYLTHIIRHWLSANHKRVVADRLAPWRNEGIAS